MTNNRMIPIDRVLEIVEAERNPNISGLDDALDTIQGEVEAYEPPAVLRTDEERAALDAYSVVQSDRVHSGQTFRNKDHRDALVAAVDAVDEVRFRAFAERSDVKVAPTERPHVTPIGGNLGVRPLGSPDPAPIKPLPTSKSSPRLHYKFGPAGSVETISLTDGQREALRTIAKVGPTYRNQICPRRLLASATSTSLLKRDLVTKHSYPVIGYRLTERGQAVVAALTAD